MTVVSQPLQRISASWYRPVHHLGFCALPMLVVPSTHRTDPSRFFCCCSIHLELSTCWDSTVRKHSHFQTSLENPFIQTHLVLLCCIKRLCIFGPKGAIQIRYYYYYYYYYPNRAIVGGVIMLYRFSRWLPLWRNFASSFELGYVAFFRSMYNTIHKNL